MASTEGQPSLKGSSMKKIYENLKYTMNVRAFFSMIQNSERLKCSLSVLAKAKARD